MLGAIAGRSRSAPGRDRVLAIGPCARADSARDAQEAVSELLALHAAGDPPPVAAPPDLRPVLTRLRTEGATLRGEELWQIATLLEQAGAVAAWLRKGRPETPGLGRMLAALDPIDPLRRDILRAVDPSGAVKDEASPDLARIRRSIRSLRERLSARLEAILRGAGSPDSFVTLREERYVIALPSSNRRAVPGAILGHSGSGASVFVEPREAAEGNSELAERSVEEAREIERILRELSARAHARHAAIEADLEALARLDAALAVTAWAREADATMPVLSDERTLLLRGARHPILVGRALRGELPAPPTPLDLALDAEHPMLLVTGPNMGGKTVAMKTVGLLALMAMSGLPVPAASGTTIPWFDRIVCDIGDEQSIENDVSTFLSHVRRVAEALRAATSRSLVLLDELGSGTDPTEGAALGQAVLEALLTSGAMTLATTHHGSLKTFAHEAAGVRNASMAFDETTLRPLFRLVVGVPGGSRAIQVAERFGMDRDVLARARALLPEGERDLNRLLIELGRLREEAVEERRRLVETQGKLAERETELRGAKERLEAERKERKQAELSARRDLLRQLESQIDDYRKRLRTEAKASTETLQRARGLAKEMSLAIDAETEIVAPVEKGSRVTTVREGDKVYVPTLLAEGVVVGHPDKDARVRVKIGAATAVLPLAQLRRLDAGGRDDSRSDGAAPKGRIPGARDSSRPLAPEAPDLSESKSEVDVRGYEADDAVRAVERVLEDAVVGGLQTVRIIHGKGKGVLREQMKRFLAHHQLVKEFRLGEMGEGGTGVTIVTLDS
ncbi:MAG TPA: Smr/MutS family protein [Candidatus Eisenbacteria bacterium]